MNEMPKHVICIGAVVRRGNRILLVRQARGHVLEGQWVIPWGLLDENESPSEAALREVQEEANIDAQIEGLLGIQELPHPWEGWLALVFLLNSESGQPTPDYKETDAARFFSLAELKNFPEPVEPWCVWLVSRVLRGEHCVIPENEENPYNPQKGFL